MRRNIYRSITWLAFAFAASAATTGGALSGTVTDDRGSPISGALVIYQSVPKISVGPNGHRTVLGPVVGSSVRTGADGTFVASNLPPAPYHLCAYGVRDSDLGSCEWTQGTVTVNVVSGQTAEASLQVAGGSLLIFQVNDPNHRIVDLDDLQTANGKPALSGANFGLGVWVGARYLKAKPVSKSGSARVYQLPVSKTAVARLFLDTALNVTDASGTPLPLRQLGTPLAPAGQPSVTTTLIVP